MSDSPKFLRRIGAALRRASECFLPEELTLGSPDVLRRARLLLGTIGALLLCALLALCRVVVSGVWSTAPVVVALLCGLLLLPLVLRRSGSLVATVHGLCAILAAAFAMLMIRTGAQTFPPFAYLPFVPMVATLIGGARTGAIWTVLAIAQLGAFYYLVSAEALARPELPAQFIEQGRFASAAFLAVFVFLLSQYYEHLKNSALSDLVIERERQVKLRDRFLSHISHELRTPIAAAQQFVSLITDEVCGPIRDEQREYLERALSNTDELVLMVDDLVSVSRLRADEVELELAAVELEAPLRDVARQSAEAARGRGIEISLAVPAELPAVHASGRATREVLGRLLDNAIKFAPEGSEVELRAFVDPQHPELVRVSVCDQGAGLDPELAEGIFDELGQARTAEWRSRKGLGLGLAICRALVQLQGGRIWHESPARHGNSFNFTLPRQQTAAASGTQGRTT
jgi:signal transduction histidine kinase